MKQDEPGIALVKRILKRGYLSDADREALMEFHPENVAKRKAAAKKPHDDIFDDPEVKERLRLEYLNQGENQ